MGKQKKETRPDEILRCLSQIDQALADINHTADNLRRERTELWKEYHGLIAGELGVTANGVDPEEAVADKD